VAERPTRRVLQPEATGATVEVTKRLKPSGNAGHELVATRVNGEQASKMSMLGPTRAGAEAFAVAASGR
jgi:hypothetical protein